MNLPLMNPIIVQLFAFRSSAFRSVKNALRFGRLSRSSSIDDDEKSLMGAAYGKSSGFDDSTDANSSDIEGGYLDRDDEDDDFMTAGGAGEDDIKVANGKNAKKKPPR